MRWLFGLLLLVGAGASLARGHDAERSSPAAAAVTADPDTASVEAVIADVRRATERYLDIRRAREDGFVQASGMEPGHGVHFVRPDLRVLATALDLARPPVLLYVEREGAWQLVGVEYALPRAPTAGPFPAGAWREHEASCHYRDWRELAAARAADCPPSHPASGAPLVHWHPAFAVVHVWAWDPNPAGPFAPEHAALVSPGGVSSPAAAHVHARNAAEVAYSELNHRVAGGFLVILAALACVTAGSPGSRLARALSSVVWIAFGAYVFVSADPEAWPLGAGRIADVFRDGLVLQHKLLSLIPVVVGLAEAARTAGVTVGVRRLTALLAVVGGAALFFHDHEGGLHLDRMFVQHAAMGGIGILAGSTLLVISGEERRAWLRWTWPVLLALTAGVLILYAE